ncbi:MAG: site-specific integrase [Candidatus Latescibacterota bacterium]
MTSRDSLGIYLRHFLVDYLAGQRNASAHTVHAYRDALKGLLLHAAQIRQRSVSDLRMEDLDQALVLSYLEALERERGNSATTRNLRLSAIHSFFRAVAQLAPERVEQAQRILAIPQKRTTSRVLGYLTVPEIQALLRQPPLQTSRGRRDQALLRFLYNTGARVQEALDVGVSHIRFEAPSHVRLLGKGRKERLCPLWPDTVAALQQVLRDRSEAIDAGTLVFTNCQGSPLTRCGVRYILSKYVRLASAACPSLQGKRIHPHTLRHTTAAHLLQSGVDLNTVRCWLGHVDLATTSRYVEADLEAKRQALGEVAAPRGRRVPGLNRSLLAWLESL